MATIQIKIKTLYLLRVPRLLDLILPINSLYRELIDRIRDQTDTEQGKLYWYKFMALLGLDPRNFSTPWALKRRRFIKISDEIVQIKSPEQQSLLNSNKSVLLQFN